jgi:hypothetical protein
MVGGQVLLRLSTIRLIFALKLLSYWNAGVDTRIL